MMKKIISLSIIACICLLMVACGGTVSNDNLQKQLEESLAKVDELETQLSDAKSKIAELEAKVNTVGDSTSKQQMETEQKDGEFVHLNLGDSVDLDFVQFTVENASWSDEIKPTDTSSVYSYMPDNENESYFWISGSMKNVSGESYSVEDMTAEIIFDDKYTYTAFLIADDGGNDFYGDYVKPLSSVKYYIYVSAPDEIKDIYSTASVKFGFQNDFEGSYYDEFDECDYLYEVNFHK